MLRTVLALIVVALVAAGIYAIGQKPTSSPTAAVRAYSLGTIEVADTDAERTQGLSDRTEVPDDYGMLFIFILAGDYGFWMKDMHVPIDIMWLSDDGTIVGIHGSIAPDTYPRTFHPPRPVRYVLETRAGLASERGWDVGTKLTLPL